MTVLDRVLSVGVAVMAAWAGMAEETPKPIVFDSPADDERGVMILGNGEVGATVWLDAAGIASMRRICPRPSPHSIRKTREG